jgi:hypothetical protein
MLTELSVIKIHPIFAQLWFFYHPIKIKLKKETKLLLKDFRLENLKPLVRVGTQARVCKQWLMSTSHQAKVLSQIPRLSFQ